MIMVCVFLKLIMESGARAGSSFEPNGTAVPLGKYHSAISVSEIKQDRAEDTPS